MKIPVFVYFVVMQVNKVDIIHAGGIQTGIQNAVIPLRGMISQQEHIKELEEACRLSCNATQVTCVNIVFLGQFEAEVPNEPN